MAPTFMLRFAPLLAMLAGLVAGAAEPSADELLRLTAESKALLERDAGLLTLEPVLYLPAFATAIEPSALMHDGGLFLVARCHGPESYEPATKTWRYVQLSSTTGWLPLQAALTDIRATDVRDLCRSPYHGPWTQVTVDLSFNPVSGRIECVATDRNGEAGAGAGNQRQGRNLTCSRVRQILPIRTPH